MSKELETAFTVNPELLPPLDEIPFVELSQVYYTPPKGQIPYEDVKAGEWRVRTTTKPDGTVEHKAAVKVGDKASGERYEFEAVLDEGDFGTTEADVAEYGSGIIAKRRYKFGNELTLDHFTTPGAPLKWLAEKEFTDTAEREGWTMPEWGVAADNLPGNREMARSLREMTPAVHLNSETLEAAIIKKQKEHGKVIVTLSGMSGSGKSRIGKHLADRFNGLYIEADNYHIGARALTEQHGEVNHDWPHTYDYVGLANDLIFLAKGGTVELPIYDFRTAERAEHVTTVSAPLPAVTIVDGLYARRVSDALAERAPGLVVHNALVDTPLYVSVLRRMMRDAGISGGETRDGAMSPEETLAYLHKVAIPTYQRYAHHPETFDTVLTRLD